MQTQITRRCVIEEETEEQKNLFATLQMVIDPLEISWDTWVSKRPSKPNLPAIPKPSKLLLQLGFLEPCLVQLSRSRNKLHVASTNLSIFQCFPATPKTLTTLCKCVDYVWVQISSQGMIMGEGRRRGYNEFSLRMSSSLSKRWVCVLQKNYLRFFSLNDLSYICG